MKNKFIITFLTSVVVASLPLFALAQSWSDPTGAPPSANASAPLNVSSSAQTKTGSLLLGDGLGLTAGNLLVSSGSVTASQFCLASVCISAWPSGSASVPAYEYQCVGGTDGFMAGDLCYQLNTQTGEVLVALSGPIAYPGSLSAGYPNTYPTTWPYHGTNPASYNSAMVWQSVGDISANTFFPDGSTPPYSGLTGNSGQYGDGNVGVVACITDVTGALGCAVANGQTNSSTHTLNPWVTMTPPFISTTIGSGQSVNTAGNSAF